MTETVEYNAKLTKCEELYNYDCPDGIRYAGWELTLMLDKPPRLEGTDFKVTFTPKPEPPPEPPPWDDAPDWARWLAQSKRGPWYWWEFEPRDIDNEWAVIRGMYTFIRDGTPNPNWRDTLQERPEPEPEFPCKCGGTAVHVLDGDGYGHSFQCRNCCARTMWHKHKGAAASMWRVRFGPELNPELCPVCSKPASEHYGAHKGALFCCPHCGGSKAVVGHTEDSFGHDHVWVRCSYCPAQTMPLDTEAEAVAAWNRRA